MEDLKNILERLKNREQVTYEELNDLLPENFILEEHIEEVIDYFNSHHITLGPVSAPAPARVKPHNYKKKEIIDNLIDTPEKFYFYELNKNKKITGEREKGLLDELFCAKEKIKNLLAETDFFLFELFRDCRGITPGENTRIFFPPPEEPVPAILKEIKGLFKVYARDKQNSASRESLLAFLQKLKFNFIYIIEKVKLLDNLRSELSDPGKENKDDILNRIKRKRIDPLILENLLSELQYLLKKYDALKQEIVKNQLPMVLSIVKHYFSRTEKYNDLIQEGNLALIEALDYYNTGAHKKEFYRFVSSRIRNKVKKYLETNNSLLTMPQNFQKETRIFLKTVNNLKNELLRTPLIEEIKLKLDWPVEKIVTMISYLQREKSLEQEDYYTNLNLKDAIVDKSQKLPEDIVIENIMKDQIMEEIERLPENEKYIIKMRFGFNLDNKVYDYKDIAKALHLTENKIKDTEEHSLKKLRVLFKNKNMEEYI